MGGGVLVWCSIYLNGKNKGIFALALNTYCFASSFGHVFIWRDESGLFLEASKCNACVKSKNSFSCRKNGCIAYIFSDFDL